MSETDPRVSKTGIMKRVIRVVVCSTIALIILISHAQPAHADVTVSEAANRTVPAGEIGHAPAGHPHGVKSLIVRELTEFLALAIRQGGDIAAWIIARLDGSAAKAFRKHARSIADELDRIAQIPDLTTRIVKEKLYYFLRNQLGLSGGTALEIADLVKGCAGPAPVLRYPS